MEQFQALEWIVIDIKALLGMNREYIIILLD